MPDPIVPTPARNPYLGDDDYFGLAARLMRMSSADLARLDRLIFEAKRPCDVCGAIEPLTTVNGFRVCAGCALTHDEDAAPRGGK